MINELWNAFPRLIVEKINALLDEAEPNSMKAFQLYKNCQTENLWQDTYEKFEKHLELFFRIPKRERKKSQLDQWLERPVSMDIFASFHLTFRNARVHARSLTDLASWSHHLVRVGYKTNSAVISEEVFTKTLHAIVSPAHFEGKDENIEFEDFTDAWKKIVFKLFGKKHDAELNAILKELNWLNAQLGDHDHPVPEQGFFPTIYLTQTEIDWTLAVRTAALDFGSIPKFPLSRGPQKPMLIDLNRVIHLYNIVKNTRLPELMQHRDRIRSTILDRCEALIREKAA